MDNKEAHEGFKTIKERFYREYLVKVLRRNRGNISAAARDAQLQRPNFFKMLVRYNVDATAIRNEVT